MQSPAANRPWRRALRRATGIAVGAALATTGVAVVAAAPVSASPAACAGKVALHPNQGKIGGIAPLAHAPAIAAGCSRAAPAAFGGTPPLLYGGGPVMGVSGTISVTPIYWAGGLGIPLAYQNLINGYLANVAADSGKATNVYSTTTQYTNGAGAHIHDNISAGTPLTDSHPYPGSGGCAADSGSVYSDGSVYSACVTDAQVQAELGAFLTGHGLTSDINHLYVVFLAKGVESCFDNSNAGQGGTCSFNVFCGYHSAFGPQASPAVYANMPYAVADGAQGTTCSSDGGGVGNQSPNGNLDADTEISITSHEVAESITDPLPNTGWSDSSLNENGDDCAYIYGSGFGGANGSHFNQVINGGHYFTQAEFSNEDFKTNTANSCALIEDPPTASFLVTTPSPAVGMATAFDASASAVADNANPGAITSWSWNFGDGSPAGSGKTLSHTYSAPGTFTATLTVVDVDLFQGSVTHQVVVNAGAVAFTSADHTTFSVGNPGSFTVVATGSPAPTLSEAGALPSGVGFNPGTGALTGTPGIGAAGPFALTFTASNGGTPVVQHFTLTVAPGTPAITWPNPADIVYGTALSATQLNPTAALAAIPIPGVFTFTPAAGTVLASGANQPLGVTFTPTDLASFATVTATAHVNVTRALLTVSADNKSKPQGAANPALTYTVTGFVNGDSAAAVTGSPVLSTTATSSSAVGGYPITITPGTLATPNYAFALTPGTLTVTPNHASFTYPSAGQQSVDTTAPFTWTAAPGAQGYVLVVGSYPQGTDLVNSGLLLPGQTSFTVPALPSGRTLYATLLTETAGAWADQAVTFTAAPGLATMTYPTDGQLNVDPSQPFAWAGIPQAQGYILVIGTTPNGIDVFNSGVLAANQSSVAAPALPAGVLYATLLTEVNGAFTRSQMVAFTAAGARATLSFPLNGAANVDTTHLFTWSTVPQAQAHYLIVGTAMYGADLVNSGVLAKATTSFDVGALPTGRTLYATLLTEVGGAWAFQVITFTAAPGLATMTYPVNGQANVSSGHPFTWSSIPGGQGYILVIGTTPNGTDLLNSGVLPAGQASVAVPTLPKNQVLFATLLTEVNGSFTRAQSVVFIAT